MRTIDWSKPLSDDERGWLMQRDRHAEIDAHDRKMAKGNDEDSTGGDDNEDALVKDADDYVTWKKAELFAEVEGREPAIDGITEKSNKAEMIEALRAWDTAYPDAE